MTGRGWWFLVLVMLMLVVGILGDLNSLSLTGLTLLLWFSWEWVFFYSRVRLIDRYLNLERHLLDGKGQVNHLWTGKTYKVQVRLGISGRFYIPYISITDPIPFSVRHLNGLTSINGFLVAGRYLELEYEVFCPSVGLARFEGISFEVGDLQGFFSQVGFFKSPVKVPILPGIIVSRSGKVLQKPINILSPPGIHRLHKPGTGSEFLDLRDYLPGDPPRSIAWKISARKNKLLTKEFESEAPIRVTLFLDGSNSARVPFIPSNNQNQVSNKKPFISCQLHRTIEIASAIIRTNTITRDLTGLTLFDDEAFDTVPPERTINHQHRLMKLLAEAASLGATTNRGDLEELIPVAYSFAQDVYPELLVDSVNSMPSWLLWLISFPRYTQYYRGWVDYLYRNNQSFFIWGTVLIPLGLFTINLVVLVFFSGVRDSFFSFFAGLFIYGSPILITGTWILFIFTHIISKRSRNLARARKKLAALFCLFQRKPVRTNEKSIPFLGGIDILLEDDELFFHSMLSFLSNHQVPAPMPLYGDYGKSIFGSPEKIKILSKALTQAIGWGRDNELFVLFVNPLDLDAPIDPFIQAVKVALGMHHEVLILCLIPEGIPPPTLLVGGNNPVSIESPSDLVHSVITKRFHGSFRRIQSIFARLGVTVHCVNTEEATTLILWRMDQVRNACPFHGKRMK